MPSHKNTPPAISRSKTVAVGAVAGGLRNQCHILFLSITVVLLIWLDCCGPHPMPAIAILLCGHPGAWSIHWPHPLAERDGRKPRRLFQEGFRHDRFPSILYGRLYLPLCPVTFGDDQVVARRHHDANRAVTHRILVGSHQAPFAGIQLDWPTIELRRVGI